MSGALFALLAVFIVGIGARDQLLVAGLAQRNGQHWALLGTAAVCAVGASSLAALAGQALAPMLAADARRMFAAFALALAGLEMLFLRQAKVGEEPTHSLGATAIVLFAQQLTDAARFIVLAIAVATAAPLSSGAGGALGGVAAVGAGWLLADDLAQRNLRPLRIAGGVALLAVAGWLALAVLKR